MRDYTKDLDMGLSADRYLKQINSYSEIIYWKDMEIRELKEEAERLKKERDEARTMYLRITDDVTHKQARNLDWYYLVLEKRGGK